MAAVRLRIRLPAASTTVQATTFGELADHISTSLGAESGWQVLTGYPPKPMETLERSVQLAGILKSGETIIVRMTQGATSEVASAAPAAAAPTAAAPAPVAPKPAAPAPVAPAPAEPRPPAPKPALPAARPASQAPAPQHSAAAAEEERLVRRVIPADNSCLFAAIAHALGGAAGRRERADGLRRIVADTVLADGERFSEAMLGSPPQEYARWILNPDHWGGGIELAILSEHFRTEIAAFDVQTQRVDCFGQEGGGTQRICLLYDGIHYDLIVKTLFEGAPEELDVSCFSTADEGVMAEARKLVKQQHDARQFTDTASFTLRCLVCQKGLVGEAEALAHAKETAHTNFAEYH